MMDAEFRRYLSAIKTEEKPASFSDPRWEETEALARRLIAENKVEAALKALEPEPARRKRWDLLLLTALLREGLGEHAAAVESFEVVADKLMAGGDRAGIRRLLERFLEPHPTTAAVRFLHFLARDETDLVARIELLRDATSIRPGDPELHAGLSAALERAGDPVEAREHRLRSIELRLELGRIERLADDLLPVIETDLAPAPARVARILLRHASTAPWEEAEPLLDLAIPDLETRAPGLLAWEDIAPAASRAPATRSSRALLARFLRMAVAREPNPDAILTGSGIADPHQPITAIADRLPKILALPPGAHVSHTSWGLGRVRASDGEALQLSFPGRADHKMSFAMASRSLDRLPDEGLRVLAIEDLPKLRGLAEGGEAEVLVRALRDVGGAATAAQLKPRLEAALPGFDWGGYWKQAKDKWKGDRRLDLSEAYRQVYRLAVEGLGEQAAVLPRLTPRAAGEGLGLIRRFLREHPDDEARIRDHAGPLVARWSAEESLDASTRAQALCYARAWGTLDEVASKRSLESLIHQGLSPDDLALSVNQEQLLDLAVGSPSEEEFLWRAAESRLPRLRLRARERLRAVLGDRYGRSVELRVSRGTEAPGLAARLIEHFAGNPGEPGAPPMSTLLLASIRLLERDLPDGVPERLGALLGEQGLLRLHFEKEPPDVESRSFLENAVVHWAGSERRLHPVLEFLRVIGLDAIADGFETRRKERAQTLLEGKSVEDLETRFTIMSRVTYERLEAELKRLGLELKTTIPAAIERARQLGDLRENAEYEAAKLKQANTAARVQELINTLERTRLLETMEIDAGRVGVGTETVLAPLEGADPPRTYWILGEGDGSLGPGVLSYRAPLARPLLGKPVGSEVVMEFPEGSRRYRIESIVKRLPT